jgi:hypothetical protein
MYLRSMRAEVAELVDALDSKSGAPKGRAGSIPAFGTTEALPPRVSWLESLL